MEVWSGVFFPDVYPEENISWESHLWGLITGMLLAFYFRKLGPQRKRYDWEDEEDDDDEIEIGETSRDQETIQINYFPPNKDKSN